MKPYPKYKESGVEWIGKIPEKWSIKALKYSLKEIVSGGTPDTSNSVYWSDDEEGIPWVAISDISESNGTLENTSKKITELGLNDKKLSIIPKGTLLISIFASLGKSTILKIDATVNQAILGLIPSVELKRDFLKYYLIDVERNLGYYSSSNTQENLNLSKIKSLPIALPSVLEQDLILEFLNNNTIHIDQTISKKQRLITLLEEEKKAIINLAVTKGLDPKAPMKDSGVEWLGQIPKHWDVKRLKYVATIQPSNVDKKSSDDETKVLLCNYVDVYKNNFINNQLEFMEATANKDEINKFLIKKGQVLITKDSEEPTDIAVPALVTEDFDNVLCGYHLTQIIPNESKLLGSYLFELFRSKRFNTQFIVAACGVTRFSIGSYDVTSAYISLPPIKEQEQIVNYITKETTKINQTINKIQREIELLQEYRTALISEAVTGKIDVRGLA